MKAIYIWCLVIICISCNKLNREKQEGKLIARVGGHSLYSGGLPQLPESIPTADSTALHNGFVEQWVQKYVMVDEAESNLSTSIDIESLVDDYSTSLLIDNFRQSIIQSKLDTAISEQELADEYQKLGENFSLAEDIYQVMWAKVGANKKGLDKFYKNWQRGKLNEVRAYCKENADDYMLDEKWISLKDLYQNIPPEKFKSKQLIKGKQLLQNHEGFEYFVKINDTKDKGETPPLSYIASKLKKLIIHKRKKELIDKLESDLYKRALAAQKIKVYR